MPKPLAPRASIYSNDIPEIHHGSDLAGVSSAGDIPHAVSTPEVIETIATYSFDATGNAATVVESFSFYGYMIIFIIIVMIVGFFLDRR